MAEKGCPRTQSSWDPKLLGPKAPGSFQTSPKKKKKKSKMGGREGYRPKKNKKKIK